ncbi:MAG: tRNA pseudouridine(55) synthase TruB [Acutalibacteraceae bacterium]
MNGVIVIDKPRDFTSFDVVAVMRKLCSQKKIGHTGTLDPMATGVLPLLMGNAAKAQDILPDSDKEYEAQFKLGIITDTLDITGKILEEKKYTPVSRSDFLNAMEKYRGDIMQIPPMYSAVKKNGVRLYDLARKGIETQREGRPVHISRLELTDYCEETGEGTILVGCSKGTYIRSLVDDIGRDLRTGGVLTALRRTCACGFTLKDCVTLEQFKALAEKGEQESRLISTECLFAVYPSVNVSEKQSVRFKNGGALDLMRTKLKNTAYEHGAVLRVHDYSGGFIGLGKINKEENLLTVLKLFPEL